MPKQQVSSLEFRQTCIKSARLARLDYLDHWCAMAHADTADTLDVHPRSGLGNRRPQGVEEPVTAFGHAARAEPDVNPGRCIRSMRGFFGRSCGTRHIV